MLGASAVWIGTRFVLSEEAGASKAHQEAVRTAGFDDNVRTLIFTGRPLRVPNNPSGSEPALCYQKRLAHRRPTKKPSALLASTTMSAPSSSLADLSECATTHTSKTGKRTGKQRSKN